MKIENEIKELAMLCEITGNQQRRACGDTHDVQDWFDYARMLLDNLQQYSYDVPDNLGCGDCQNCG